MNNSDDPKKTEAAGNTNAALASAPSGIPQIEPIKLSDAERRLMDNNTTDREIRLHQLQQQLQTMDWQSQAPETVVKRALTSLEIAGLQLDLDDKESAWEHARPLVTVFIDLDRFEDAAMAAQYVYLCDRDDAISAIGQAAWLAVTYPVDPHLTANILDHIVDETPDDSDGAAVAAATAHYVADLRCTAENSEAVRLFTGSMLARVAKRHSNIESQEKFEHWVRLLELDEPEKFLVRLRNVIDVMVQDDWWFDREALSAALPESTAE
jgi:hypothetical protein